MKKEDKNFSNQRIFLNFEKILNTAKPHEALTMKYFLILFILIGTIANSSSQNTYMLTEELRGVWLGTAFNNDWPLQAGLSTDEQKRQLQNYFTQFKKLSINAVFFQVRPMGDALYPSKTEPWSRYLSGISGVAPHPFYDPLAFAIDLAEQENMELHAWFNPFRALMQNRWDNTDFFRTKYKVFLQHPDWFIDYGNRKYFNPGIPEVREYVISVIMEVVRNYPQIAGVHFDDYFYPYPQKEEPAFNDIKTYYKYRQNNQNIKDWRRHNINEFIRQLHDSIQTYNPKLKLGVAPPAVWRNKGYDNRGSNTLGLSAYDDLFADTRKWLAEGWIDYMVPQMYAEIGNKHGDFKALADWWNNNHFNKHIYAGIALYRLDPKSPYNAWRTTEQIKNQLNIVRQNPAFRGEVYFSAKNLLENTLSVNNMLSSQFYQLPAQVPSMWWKESQLVLLDSTAYLVDEQGNETNVKSKPEWISLAGVTDLHLEKKRKEVFLFWNWAANANCRQQVVFEIYKFEKEELLIPDEEHLIATSLNSEIALDIKNHLFKRKYTYLVKVKCGVFQSQESEPITIRY